MTFDEVIVSRRADMRVLSKSLHWVSINPKPIVVDFDFLLSFVSSPSNLIKYCRYLLRFSKSAVYDSEI
ncbi:hypothetical protein SLEP1_g55746 [Rubroshorea leprosula]|uniref:Uncharacterized protein n=1 Tax=Rubroshorea leprosula TaxID=152421 RepID=A0AAV5MIJ5_9ROSI|nr:hypothetical protein SLEP1_g55746 [Rubroshorea leprosula]